MPPLHCSCISPVHTVPGDQTHTKRLKTKSQLWSKMRKHASSLPDTSDLLLPSHHISHADIFLTSPVRYLGPWPHVPVRLLPPSGREVSVHRSRSPPPPAPAELQVSTVAGPHYCKLGKQQRQVHKSDSSDTLVLTLYLQCLSSQLPLSCWYT